MKKPREVLAKVPAFVSVQPVILFHSMRVQMLALDKRGRVWLGDLVNSDIEIDWHLPVSYQRVIR